MNSKKIINITIIFVFIIMLFSCSSNTNTNNNDISTDENITENKKENEMLLYIDDKKIDVIWEENESVEALKDKIKEDVLELELNRYGGFEQVGELGFDLPSNDVRISTKAGDILLYLGDHICLYFSENTWSFTRLRKIDLPEDEIVELLDKENVNIKITIE